MWWGNGLGESFAQIGNVGVKGWDAIQPMAAKRSAAAVGDVGAINTLGAFRHRRPGIAAFRIAGNGRLSGSVVPGEREKTPKDGAPKFTRKEQREATLNQYVFFNAAKTGRGCGRPELRAGGGEIRRGGGSNVGQPLRHFER